ncbi:GDP-mannose mannosyl hydrolase [Parendozoicomonas sp. Alg238-R29]|uniref:GDP-mannose mannosyl hydrolase n=1 Tax=Parendozoicomonas sp. Alg238-R29 TaxID=2993446 RepID=UPI00248EE1DC|nr:GDP-mannose mannosyl hydrolase [Parendozoicomonas sp. Alg238-R29]
MIHADVFKSVVANAPLISIDLVVKNEQGQILLGLRDNRPAQGFWFVPGGRIRKDESIKKAFSRLAFIELGINLSIKDAEFIGVYEHFYSDNFSGTDFSTHYIVMGYCMNLDVDLNTLPHGQHREYRYVTKNELLNCLKVHKYTKNYFL